jgi:hypothetical protein
LLIAESWCGFIGVWAEADKHMHKRNAAEERFPQ